MRRQEDFIQAGIKYRFEHGKPMAIGGDNFADVANELNRCKDFEAGAEHGYQYAVEKAREWLESMSGYTVYGQKANLKNFRKAMEL